jgi:hypothetical protein
MLYMKKKTFSLVNLVMVFTLLFSGGSRAAARAPDIARANSVQENAQLISSFDKLPLIFVQNQGQMDGRVAFSLQGRDTSIYFASDGLTFALTEPITDTTASSPATPRDLRSNSTNLKNSAEKTSRWILKLEFVGANPGVVPQGEDKAETVVSYFKGSPKQWRAGLPTFQRLVYHNLWEGIDLVYSGSGSQLKYEFLVEPGADPADIRLAYRGASSLELDEAGNMQVTTPYRSFQDDAPTAYQVIGGVQKSVTAAYRVQGAAVEAAVAAGNAVSYSFQLGAYDASLPLVIDPVMLVYCGYIGGNAEEEGGDIAVDSSGAAYITGATESQASTFPVSVGPDLTYNGGDKDIFVAKVKPDGSGLVYAGYIGGGSDEYGESIAVDESGAAYITGLTGSTEYSFPVKGGPDLTYNGSEYDAFVAKVKPDGSGLVYAGYIGGSGEYEQGSGIAVDASGAAYVTGVTESDESSFPVKGGPDLTYNGSGDAFVAKVKPDGSGLIYAGYIGGNGQDSGSDIVVDSIGAAYITGSTISDQTTFPIVGGPDLTYNSNTDAFVAKVEPDGSGLVYAGYIGGSKMEFASGIDIDSSGAAYVVGLTYSDQSTFPVSGGPDITFNGDSDAFVAKVKPDGSGLIYAGYIGGSKEDQGKEIAVDSKGAAYVTGQTQSDQTSFPVVGGPDLTFNSKYDYDNDAFVAKLRIDGSRLVYAGYIGGSDDDHVSGIAVDSQGAAYIIGDTTSNESSFPVVGGPDLTYSDSGDAFVAKIGVVYPVLSINYFAGSPGSYFTITGADYPIGQNVTVVVNGHVLTDTLALDESGSFMFLIDTGGADSGK